MRHQDQTLAIRYYGIIHFFTHAEHQFLSLSKATKYLVSSSQATTLAITEGAYRFQESWKFTKDY